MTDGAPRHRRVPTQRNVGHPPGTTLFFTALFTGACAAFAWTAGSAPIEAGPARSGHVDLVAAAPDRQADGGTPARIDITKIGVSASIESLGRNADGTMATPIEPNNAGWYAEGVAPGERGPAVLAGHRDSAADGPAVFYRLDELTSGDEVSITERDGTAHRFVVVASEQVAKSGFPSAQVYAPSSQPLLRLITCVGGFDVAAGSYVDNLVVTARAV